MKKAVLLIILVMSSTGCATTHDWCMSRLDHYSSYDECYAERTATKDNAKHSWENIWSKNKQTTVTCQSHNYGAAGIQTTCQ